MLEVFKVYIQFITAQFCHLRSRRSFQPTIISPLHLPHRRRLAFHRFLFIFFSTLSLIVITCIYLATHPARSLPSLRIKMTHFHRLFNSFAIIISLIVFGAMWARDKLCAHIFLDSKENSIHHISHHTYLKALCSIVSYIPKSIVVFHEILFWEIIEFSSPVYLCRSHQHSVSFRRIGREKKSQANITQCRDEDKQTFTLFESSQLELWLALACTRSVKKCDGEKTFEENKIYLNWLSDSHEKWHLLTSSSYMPYDFDKISDSFTAQQLVKSEGETDDPRVHLSCDSKNKQNRQAPMPLTQRSYLSFIGVSLVRTCRLNDRQQLSRFVHYIHSIF